MLWLWMGVCYNGMKLRRVGPVRKSTTKGAGDVARGPWRQVPVLNTMQHTGQATWL